jgi:hypothetical protein
MRKRRIAGPTPADPTTRCDIDGRPLDSASRRWRVGITYQGKAASTVMIEKIEELHDIIEGLTGTRSTAWL